MADYEIFQLGDVRLQGGATLRDAKLAYKTWLRRFVRDWPEGSPAHRSYHGRFIDGPGYSLGQAARGGVTVCAGLERVSYEEAIVHFANQ